MLSWRLYCLLRYRLLLPLPLLLPLLLPLVPQGGADGGWLGL
jgi:hypothetical protein